MERRASTKIDSHGGNGDRVFSHAHNPELVIEAWLISLAGSMYPPMSPFSFLDRSTVHGGNLGYSDTPCWLVLDVKLSALFTIL